MNVAALNAELISLELMLLDEPATGESYVRDRIAEIEYVLSVDKSPAMFTVEMRIRNLNKPWGGIHAQYGDVPSYFGALFSTKEAAEAYVADADAKYPSSERRIVEADEANAIRVGDRVEFKAGKLNKLEGQKGWLKATVEHVDGCGRPGTDGITVMADYRAADDTDPRFKDMRTMVTIHDIRKSKKD